jgi:hypothetical protein
LSQQLANAGVGVGAKGFLGIRTPFWGGEAGEEWVRLTRPTLFDPAGALATVFPPAATRALQAMAAGPRYSPPVVAPLGSSTTNQSNDINIENIHYHDQTNARRTVRDLQRMRMARW